MKIAIYGYGNLGKGVELAARRNPDAELVGIFTRRSPDSVKPLTDGLAVYSADSLPEFKDKIDVLIVCAGSATDLPTLTPALASDFNLVDSFDTHAEIPAHFSRTDKAAAAGGRLALISAGWDPGLFSIARLYSSAVLPLGMDYTFWGRGVSQGHSDAIRRIDGVVDARQYTVPIESAVESVKRGENPVLSSVDKHLRECYVVVEDGADKAAIAEKIKSMPNYFAEYNTTVNFVSHEELLKNHSALPHGGRVIRTGKTGIAGENTHTVEFSLKLDSNPEFTGSVLIASARAVYRMHREGRVGAITLFDVPPAYLSFYDGDELRRRML